MPYAELDKTRAMIKIQDGCDRFCSYCIIPYARGRVVSRPVEEIVKEVEVFAEKGIKEVVITGIHIASYGKDFVDKSCVMPLIELLKQINSIDGIERIRLGSLEPMIITEEFIVELKNLHKICEHFHLSLQSGCDTVLQRMNRKYITEEFKNVVNIIRNTYSNVAITTDIIVGFPGETEEEFNVTYEFLKEINFYQMHVFKYSPRKGTKAADMPNQIDAKVKDLRSNMLIKLSKENEKEYMRGYIGKKVKVLFEQYNGHYIEGHTSNYMLVGVKEEQIKNNEIREVIIKNVVEDKLIGTVIL